MQLDILGNTREPHLVFAVARRRNLGSFITRVVDPGARWGHTAFFDQERGVMNEALLFKGVTETPIEHWFEHYSAWQLFAVPVPNPLEGVAFQRVQVGKGYDYLGATSVPWRTSWQDGARWYCSEKDAYSIHAAGRPFCRDLKRGIHPHDFWRFSAS